MPAPPPPPVSQTRTPTAGLAQALNPVSVPALCLPRSFLCTYFQGVGFYRISVNRGDGSSPLGRFTEG